MSSIAVAVREGTRLARASTARSAVVAITIAGAAAFGIAVTDAGAGCVALAVVVLVVARRSPRPERLESAHAWSRAGAGRFAVWLAGTSEALLVGWASTLAGAAVGIGLGNRTSTGYRTGFLLALLAWLAVVACLPTRRAENEHKAATRATDVRSPRVVLRLIAIAAAVLLASGAATTIDSSFELLIDGTFILVLLACIILLVSGFVPALVVRVLGQFPRVQPLTAIASRHRAPATVRLVIAGAVTVATGITILGASVEGRPETQREFDVALSHVPVLPSNVALVRLEPDFFGPSSGVANLTMDSALKASVEHAIRGAESIELRDLGTQSLTLFCTDCVAGRFIVAEPRLHAIYGGDARYPAPSGVIALLSEPPRALDIHGSTRVTPRLTVERTYVETKQLPPASFDGAVYYEVAPREIARLHLTPRVQSVFVRAPHPFTRTELARLAQIVRAAPSTRDAHVTLIGPAGQLVPTAGPSPNPLPKSLRQQPLAATSVSSRWTSVVVASVLALVALLATLAIDTIDRRRDVRRLERLGATPNQVRGAAALYAGALFVVVTWVTVLLVTVWVRFGTHTFTSRHPETPIPFVVPWPIVVFLSAGLPLLAAGLAAVVARPLPARVDDRND